jgi:hypothetical protein
LIINTWTIVNAKVFEGSPKKRACGRTIALDDVTAAALQSWRAVPAQERLLVGPGWRETGLVFAKPDGTGVPPNGSAGSSDVSHGWPGCGRSGYTT